MSTFDAAKANKNRNQGHDPIWQQETSQSQHQQPVQPPNIVSNVDFLSLVLLHFISLNK